MSVELKLTFATVAELQAFLSAGPAKVASAQPTAAVVTPIAAAPVAAAPVAAAPVAAVAAVAAAPAADHAALRASLMTRLRSAAEGMADPSSLGAFINTFGVARFSELPDDKLAAFDTAFTAQFPS